MYEYRDNAVEFTTASGSQLRRQLRGPRYFISRVSASFIRGRPISRALRNAPLSSLRNERERETFENIKLVARILTIFSISWNNASKSISFSRFPEKQKEKKIDRRRQTLEKFNELESALPSPQKQAKTDSRKSRVAMGPRDTRIPVHPTIGRTHQQRPSLPAVSRGRRREARYP